MIDYNQIYQNIQGQGEQANKPSYFPETFGSSLASLLRAFGSYKALSLGQKQEQFKFMLDNAKNFGLPGLRKLWTDSSFTSLAKELRIQLPELPPMGSGETEESRKQALLQSLQNAQQDLTTKLGHPPSPGELRTYQSQLAQQYPDLAAGMGLGAQQVPASVMATITRAMANPETPASRIMAMIDLSLRNSGIDPASMPLDQKALVYADIPPLLQAKIDNLEATATQRRATAGLQDTKNQQLVANFELARKKLEAEVDALQNRGDYYAAAAAVDKFKAEWEPKLAQSLIDVRASQVSVNQSRIALIQSDSALKQGQLEIIRATGAYGKATGSLNAQVNALKAVGASLAKQETIVANKLLFETDPTKQEALQEYDTTLRQQIDDVNTKLLDLQDRLQRGATNPDSNPNPNPPEPGAGPLPFQPSNPGTAQLFNFIIDPKNKLSPKDYSAAFKKLRTSNFKGKETLKPTDWDQLWNMLVIIANKAGVSLGAEPK